MADNAWGCIMADEMGLGELRHQVMGMTQNSMDGR
jgi:hypothetical protein